MQNSGGDNNDGYSSTVPYLTKYERVQVIASRATMLAQNGTPYIALDPVTRCAVPADSTQHGELLPLPRFLGDELDVAELELGLGTLGDFRVVRQDGSANPPTVFVKHLMIKSQY